MPPKPAARSSAGPETVTVRRGRRAAARVIPPGDHPRCFSPPGPVFTSPARLVAGPDAHQQQPAGRLTGPGQDLDRTGHSRVLGVGRERGGEPGQRGRQNRIGTKQRGLIGGCLGTHRQREHGRAPGRRGETDAQHGAPSSITAVDATIARIRTGNAVPDTGQWPRGARYQPAADLSASPSAFASSGVISTTRRPPPSSGTRMTMPRPSLVTSSGPSPVRGFIAAMLSPLELSPGWSGSPDPYACRHARARGATPEECRLMIFPDGTRQTQTGPAGL